MNSTYNNRRKCGLVRLVIMNPHIMLKALSSLQAQTNDLKIYVKDSNNGTKKT